MNTKSDFLVRLKSQKERFSKDILYRFLNPVERTWVKSVFKDFFIYESDDSSEYRRVYVSDIETNPNFNITYLCAKYDDDTITHRDILGALTSLGIERNVFGDILITKSHIYIQVDAIMTDYVLELHQIKRDFVCFEVVTNLPDKSEEKVETILLSLDSLRVDALVAKAFKLNRENVKALIDQEKIKINFIPVQKYTIICKPYDIISVRGFGRIRLVELLGESKKQKTRIKCELLR